MEKKKYSVLAETRFVAGFRNPGKDGYLELTDLQAEHPLRIGEIEPYVEKKADPKPAAAAAPKADDSGSAA